jgi:hypothetical protein
MECNSIIGEMREDIARVVEVEIDDREVVLMAVFLTPMVCRLLLVLLELVIPSTPRISSDDISSSSSGRYL